MAAAVLTEKCETATVIGRVYKVVHVASGKDYVGRTNAKTLGTRWHWHVHKARHATKLNSAILQAAIREFGEHAFVRSELGTAEHLEDLMALEARYISELNSLAPNGFNLHPGLSRPNAPRARSVVAGAGSFPINKLALQAGCDLQTVRFYERKGLLPDPKRTATGARVFGEPDLVRLNFIPYLRSMGMSVADIAQFMASEGSAEDEKDAVALLDSQLALVGGRLRSLRLLHQKLLGLRTRPAKGACSRARILRGMSELCAIAAGTA